MTVYETTVVERRDDDEVSLGPNIKPRTGSASFRYPANPKPGDPVWVETDAAVPDDPDATELSRDDLADSRSIADPRKRIDLRDAELAATRAKAVAVVAARRYA